MAIIIHRAKDRGQADHGWLKTHYSFSFADWYEPTRMGFGALLVINDDTIAPQKGFDLHDHADMEIITIVTKGAVTHGDNMGNKEVISSGHIQVMSAGTGVMHSEFNQSATAPLELFQIWITPKKNSIKPSYAERAFPDMGQEAGRTLLVSPDGRNKSLEINQDAFIEYVVIDKAEPLIYKPYNPNNGLYVFLVEGKIKVDNEVLEKRDAAGLISFDQVKIESVGVDKATVLLFEVPIE